MKLDNYVRMRTDGQRPILLDGSVEVAGFLLF